MKKIFVRIVAPLLIVAAGIATASALKLAASKPKRKPIEERAKTVEVVEVVKSSIPLLIEVTGVVVPARRVEIIPEVSGRIIRLSDKLIPGERFRKGEVIARIDPRDYELAIAQEKSRVRQAQLELELEHGRGNIAAREWELMNKKQDKTGNPLALRTPQLETAKENLQAARSGLQRAELSRERTVIRAPFNAIVLDKYVDIGQLVGPNTKVATLIGTDQLWVNASVPMEKISAISIPGLNAEKGSTATIIHDLLNGTEIRRPGQVLRLQGELDTLNRTARILIGVENPYDTDRFGLPLLPSAYVEIEIQGRTLENAYQVPRLAMLDNRFVWIVDERNRLQKTGVTVVWRARKWVAITEGLKPKARVVISPMSLPVSGMVVSPQLVADITEKMAYPEGNIPFEFQKRSSSGAKDDK